MHLHRLPLTIKLQFLRKRVGEGAQGEFRGRVLRVADEGVEGYDRGCEDQVAGLVRF